MPIDLKKYPPNWQTIKKRIKKRAGNKCEFCSVKNGAIHPITKKKVELQIMHLDHDPENWDVKDSRLRAACQWCHTNYDKIEKHKKDTGKKKIKYKLKIEYVQYDIMPSQSDYSFILESLEKRPTKRRRITIPEYAETTIIPSGMYRGSMFRNNRAPYMIEPMEMMGPESNIQQVVLMWPAQSAKTTISEMVGMYYIDVVPSENIYVGSTAAQIKKWWYKRIEPRARKKGIEFRAQTDDKKTRRSGDTQFAKEFDGGDFDLASAQSAASLASETKRVILADEVDRWKAELGAEGYTWNIMYARSQAWGDQKKILAFSTPTTYDESLIWVLYEEGDQRQFWVRCPLCYEKQLLTLYVIEKHGLYWETKSGKLDYNSIKYICPHCNKSWKENYKHIVLNTGEWKSQVEPKTPYISSYQINGIYSPFLPWSDIAQAWIDSEGDPVGRKDFFNLKMGMPYRETGSRPKAQKIFSQRGNYQAGTIPEGVLFLTIGADIQRGANKYRGMTQEKIEKIAADQDIKGNYSDLPRIELEILGIGAGYRTWSIDYKRFEGAIDNPFEGAWERFNNWAINTELEFKRKDGHIFIPKIIFIDSGDGGSVNSVYRFCERWKMTYASKGYREITRRKMEKPDEYSEFNMKRYRLAESGKRTGIYYYQISTNYYKNMIYANIDIDRQDYKLQRSGFCDFPADYGKTGTVYEHYFDMLSAEEKLTDHSFKDGGRRNEALDCRVYASCAADVYLEKLIDNYRLIAKSNKMNQIEIEKIDKKWILELLKKETGNIKYYEK